MTIKENKHNLIIALPTFNERESIEQMINRVSDMGYPLFIVDNNSTDGTIDIAGKLNVEVIQRSRDKNGYGCGIQLALETAKNKGYEYLGILDCDTTYFPEDFRILEKYMPETDLIVGARPMSNISFSHRLANYIHTCFTSLLFGKYLKDVNSGMRIIRVKKFAGKLTAYNMGLVAQMTSMALRKKMIFEEVPIRYGERLGQSKVRAYDGIVILWKILKERLSTRK